MARPRSKRSKYHRLHGGNSKGNLSTISRRWDKLGGVGTLGRLGCGGGDQKVITRWELIIRDKLRTKGQEVKKKKSWERGPTCYTSSVERAGDLGRLTMGKKSKNPRERNWKVGQKVDSRSGFRKRVEDRRPEPPGGLDGCDEGPIGGLDYLKLQNSELSINGRVKGKNNRPKKRRVRHDPGANGKKFESLQRIERGQEKKQIRQINSFP